MTHTPVLLKKVIAALDVEKGQKYIDATFGEGGHSRAILERGGQVLGIEWDQAQYKKSKIKYQKHILNIKNLRLAEGSFSEIEKIARENDFCPVAGVLFDLGISMVQIDKSGRGFSYQKEEESLDMRISHTLKLTAADIINSSSAQQLYEIFARNAEEINSWLVAEALFQSRLVKKITTVGDLLHIINGLKLKGNREGIIRRIFQALRVEVNHEFENLKRGLAGAMKILQPEGRIVVITFHQGEDRIVKQFVRRHKLRFFTKKPVVSTSQLSFERSAKLRIVGLG